jgi:pyruvate dehydrogenase (quinone)
MEGADLLLLLGTDFPYDQFLPDVRTAQVDIDARRLGRRTRNDVAVHGDVGETIRALLPMVQQRRSRRFLDSMLTRHRKAMGGVVGAYTKDVEDMRPIHPEFAAVVLDEEAPDDAVFTVDTGMGNVWGARYITPNGRRRVIGSFLHGSMANALPHAIGAAMAGRRTPADAAHPEGEQAEQGSPRHVVAIAGDGGLSMLMGELVTLRVLDLPVKIILFDNASLAMVRLEMLVDGLPSWATDTPPIDYAAIASAVGIPSVRVEDPRQIRTALREVFSHDGPALVDLVTDPRALSLPPKITRHQVGGFTAAMSKEVLGGGLGEVMAMARSNLRNVPR